MTVIGSGSSQKDPKAGIGSAISTKCGNARPTPRIAQNRQLALKKLIQHAVSIECRRELDLYKRTNATLATRISSGRLMRVFLDC